MKLFLAFLSGVAWVTIAHADIRSDALKLDDAALLARLHIVNLAEIKLGELAAQKTQQSAVAEYGKKLAKDYAEADKIVLELAQVENLLLPKATPVSPEEAQRLQAHREKATEIALTMGRTFDREFLAFMIKGHQEIIEYLTYAQPKNPRVQGLVQILLPAIRGHLRLAQQIATSF